MKVKITAALMKNVLSLPTNGGRNRRNKMKLYLYLILCIFISVVELTVNCSSDEDTTTKEQQVSKEDEITKMIHNASKMYGKEYEGIREAILKKPEEASPILEKLREDELWDIRMTAYFLLGWIKYEKIYRKIISDPGIGPTRSGRYRFEGWGNVEIIPLLLEIITKDKEHSYDIGSEQYQRGFERCKRAAVTNYLRQLLPQADKEIRQDINLLSPNSQIKKFVLGVVYEPMIQLDNDYRNNKKESHYYSNIDRKKLFVQASDVVNNVKEEEIQRIIKEEKDESDKATLYLALHLKGDDKALTDLLKTIPDFKSSEAKLKALKIIGEVVDKTFIPQLEDLVKKTEGEELKKAISEAIDKITLRSQKKEDGPPKKDEPKKEEPKKEEPK